MPPTKQTARKSSRGHAPRSESPLEPPDWLSSATTGVLILRNEHGRCEASWSEAPCDRTLNMRWGDLVEEAMDTFVSMTKVPLSSEEDHYWFEDIDGNPHDPYSELGDVMGDEDGWVKVYIRTKEENEPSNPKKRRRRSASTTPSGEFDDYELGFIRQDDGKVVITWGACLLIVPGTRRFGRVIRSLAQLQGINVSSDAGSIIADDNVVEDDCSLANALGNSQWDKAQTMTISLRTV